MLNLEGCGLPNVLLAGGYREAPFEGGKAYSYADIGGLYEAIAHAIATSRHPLTGNEFRFLRKRLGWSQAEAGACLDKSAQAVAKWEKGETDVPRADGHVMRLAWLRNCCRDEIVETVDHMFGDHPSRPEREYVFMYVERWFRVDREWADAALQLSHQTVEVRRDQMLEMSADARVEVGTGEEIIDVE